MWRSSKLIITLAVLLVSVACHRVPSYVIQPEEMAELMADVRMADAVVSVQNRDFPSEAHKIALKQAVLEKHGVTAEQFDTSLIWYGHNIGRYQEVTDESIEILEARLKEAGAKAAGEAAMSVSGDSVDIWSGPQALVFNHRSPSEFVEFSFSNDRNWERGDVYTFRAHVINPAKAGHWNITAEYDDGAVEMITSNISQTEPKRQEISLYTDSTRTATRISGWMRIQPDAHRPAILDSISLTRRHIVPGTSIPYRGQQRKILSKKAIKNDSVDSTTDDEQPKKFSGTI